MSVRSKTPVMLIALFAVALGALTFAALKVNSRRPLFFQASADELDPFLKSFRESHRPLIEINFTDLYAGAGQFHILHPLLNITSIRYRLEHPACSDNDALLAGNRFQPPRELFEKARAESHPDDETSSAQQGRRKSAILAKFIRSQKDLPPDFIRTPPLLDEQGNSYAFLLSELGPPPFNTKAWVEQNLSFFKTQELRRVLALYQISDRRFRIIAELAEPEIADVVKGLPLVLTSEYLFIKDESRLGFSPLSYWVYDAKDLRASLADGKYELSVAAADSLCLQKIGNACWSYNSKHTLAYLNRYSAGFIVLTALLVGLAFAAYLRNRYIKAKEQAKSRLALQVLSHEFRTPVASMLLQFEQLAAGGELSDFHADLFTNISSEVFKLQRIIEISKTYLQTGNHRLQFKPVEISSVNRWLLDYLEESRFKVEYQLLDSDTKMVVDPFWLRFVLSSLVDNAFAHGLPPVTIRLRNEIGKLKISVEDGGNCEFSAIHQMSAPFVKSPRSQGMGLGLNITKYVLDDWGGKLEFTKYPTSFTVILRSL